MIEDRYASAITSSHLRDENHKLGHIDVIKASGMSSRNFASVYLRLITKPTRENMEKMYWGLANVAITRKLPTGIDAVAPAIEHIINCNCKKCKGAGVVESKGTEHKCPHCGGEGKRKAPVNKCVALLVDHVIQCKNAHASRMLQKMR